jgi:hypothetical protein
MSNELQIGADGCAGIFHAVSYFLDRGRIDHDGRSISVREIANGPGMPDYLMVIRGVQRQQIDSAIGELLSRLPPVETGMWVLTASDVEKIMSAMSDDVSDLVRT